MIERRRSERQGFTLVEVVVVAAILVILMGILVPALGRAKEHARTVKCLSGLHQWGIAGQLYENDWKGFLPYEGSNAGWTRVDAWFNALPPYVNAAKYGDIYTGASVGAGGGYANTWIWYCPTRLMTRKNSASGDNSFHYSMNAVLNGTTDCPPNWSSPPDIYYQPHLLVYQVTQPQDVPFMGECVNNNANLTCVTAGGDNVDYTRHLGTSSNMLFLDMHGETVKGTDLGQPTNRSLVSPTNPLPPYESQGVRGTTFWGPFHN